MTANATLVESALQTRTQGLVRFQWLAVALVTGGGHCVREVLAEKQRADAIAGPLRDTVVTRCAVTHGDGMRPVHEAHGTICIFSGVQAGVVEVD
jgi:hypothetical protein